MAASPRHGGGITLAKVIPDLKQFTRFVHVSGFALSSPIRSDLAKRQWNLFRPRWVYAASRWAPSFWLVSAMHKRSIQQLLTLRPDWTPEEKANRIAATMPLKNSRWLIVPQSAQSVLIANRLKRRHDIRYVTWVMDDHVVEFNGTARYPAGYEEEFGFHLRQAACVFVISPTMGAFYRERFGVEPVALFAPVEEVRPPRYELDEGPTRLAYFGALSGWQRDPLCALASQLCALRAELHVFSFSAPYESWVGNQSVICHGGVSPERVATMLATFEGVIVPASFRPEMKRMTRLNIPTKLAETIGSGTVPIVIAPADSAIAELLRGSGAGLLVEGLDATAFAELGQLREPAARRRLLDAAQQLAQREFSKEEMQRRWAQGWGRIADGPN